MRRSATVGALALALTLAACTGSSVGQSTSTAKPVTPQPLSWTLEQSVPGLQPGGITTDPLTDMVYVGGAVKAAKSAAYSGPLIKGGSLRPALWERTGDGTWKETLLKVTSFYGAQATLSSVAAGLQVTALGAVAGGAHANPRPSFFAGSFGGLTEHEQNFYLYGGENAVSIVSVAVLGVRELLMVGQWAPDGHRASGALWTSTHGETYVRHDAIPGLADSLGGKRTTSPLAGAGVGQGFAIVGSVTDLTKPGLSILPSIWTSADGTAVTQGTMPDPPGAVGGPSAIACRDKPLTSPTPQTAGTCVTAGLLTVGGGSRLAAWRITVDPTAKGRLVDTSRCVPPPPAPAPGSSSPQAPTVRVGLDAAGTGWVVASTSRAGTACRVVDLVAYPVTTPPGCVPIAVETPQPGRAELVCTDAKGVVAYRQG
jgi:hypothetical protein